MYGERKNPLTIPIARFARREQGKNKEVLLKINRYRKESEISIKEKLYIPGILITRFF
jgi:hypothetical protein